MSQSIIFRKAFSQGVKPEETIPSGSEFLDECRGLRPSPRGLITPAFINHHVSHFVLPYMTWPYVQYFMGDKFLFAGGESSVGFRRADSYTTLIHSTLYPIATATTPAVESLNQPNFETVAGPPATHWSIPIGPAEIPIQPNPAVQGWRIDGNVGFRHLDHTVGFTTPAVQYKTITPPLGGQAVAIIAGVYRVTFDLSNTTAGSVTFHVGTAATPATWVSDGITYSADGSYTTYINVTSSAGNMDFIISPSADFNGTLDNVSCRALLKAVAPNPVLAAPTGSTRSVWRFANIGNSAFASRHDAFLALVPCFAAGAPLLITQADHDLTCTEVCRFGDRIAFGNLSSTTRFTTSTFNELWDTWLSQQQQTYTDRLRRFDQNTIIISSRFGGDLKNPFFLEMALLGFYAVPTRQQDTIVELRDAILKGEITFVQLPEKGTLKCLKQLGNGLVAYTSQGVYYLSESASGDWQTYQVLSAGTLPLPAPGVSFRSCVAGDELEHQYISNQGTLCSLTAGSPPSFRFVGQGSDGYRYLLSPFSESVGAMRGQVITGGTFASSANWTLEGNWAIGAGVLSHTPSAGLETASQSEDQQQAGHELIPHTYYKVTFDCTVAAGSFTPYLGTEAVGAAVTATGSYTRYSQCADTTTFSFVCTNTFNGTIDNLSVEEFSTVCASFDPKEREFYFCNSWLGYLSNAYGVCETTKKPASLVREEGGFLLGDYTYGLFVEDDRYTFDVTLSPQDWEIGEQKTLSVLDLGYEGLTNVRVGVDWRNTFISPFRHYGPFLTNLDGMSLHTITAREMRFVIKGTFPAPATILEYEQGKSISRLRAIYNLTGKKSLGDTHQNLA